MSNTDAAEQTEIHGPRTAAEARALPETTFAERLAEGRMWALPRSGDDVMLFIDADGRPMRPVAFRGRWHKEEFWL